MNQLASLPAQQSLAPLQIVSVDKLKLEIKMLKQQVIDLLDELRGNVRLLLEVREQVTSAQNPPLAGRANSIGVAGSDEPLREF